MESKVGQIIKYYRIKSGMTQSELARGIVSVSYLSKIENCKINPPEEIVDMLSGRLDIRSVLINSSSMIKLCKDWFRYLLLRDKSNADKLYQEIKDNDNYEIKSFHHLVELHKLRYYLLLNKVEEAEEQFYILDKMSDSFDGIQKYYWYKFAGNYYYYLNLSYKKSLNYYQKAEKYLNKEIDYYIEEESDLFYAIALVAGKLRNTHLSLVYGNKALDYYQSIYNYKNCADCHILLGIVYQRINDFSNSERNYKLAVTIANFIKDDGLLKLCYQNLGKLYSKVNDSEQAIKYYLKSNDLRDYDPLNKRLITISSLMKEYYQNGDFSNASKWLHKGLELLKLMEHPDPIYEFEFKVHTQLIEGINESFEPLLRDEVIPFFELRGTEYEKNFYSNILANYYYRNRKYKLAASYFKESNDSLIHNFSTFSP